MSDSEPIIAVETQYTTLGEQLRERRLASGFSIETLAQEIKTSPERIEAFEDNRFFYAFSAKVYARGLLKQITHVIAPDAQHAILAAFENEWGIYTHHQKPQQVSLPQSSHGKLYITPQRIGFIVFVLLFSVFGIFLSLRLHDFLGLPELSIAEPAQETQVSQPVILLRGKTEKESKLTVNGRDLTIDEVGNFRENIELTPGVNMLEIIARNKFGKERKDIRYVVVQ